MDVVIAVRQRKDMARVGDRILCVAAIDLIAGKAGIGAEILVTGLQ